MEALLIGVMALLIGFTAGVVVGARLAGQQIGRQLKADIEAGRLSREDALRIAEMPDARSR